MNIDPNEDPITILSMEDFEELLEEDVNSDFESLRRHIHDLCSTGYLEILMDNHDHLTYKARSRLSWTEIVQLVDPIKKKILAQLTKNPKCFFILYNTQKGKLRLAGKEIASWISLPNKKVVSYMIVANDRTLSEQSVNGLFSCFPVKPGFENSTNPEEKYNVKIYELSSNTKVSYDSIIHYIEAYASPYNQTFAMPLIVILANPKQIEKLLRILVYIQKHPSSNLAAGGIWDEADLTYKQFAEEIFTVDGQQVNFRQILADDSTIIRNGWVTATEGDLLEEQYEECANAYHYQAELDEADQPNYFAFNHEDCKQHHIRVHIRDTNNLIAQRILDENWTSHFNTSLTLRDGSQYHHKTIINSDARGDEMRRFAQHNRHRYNVLTFNMKGITLYKESGESKRYVTKQMYRINNGDRRRINLNMLLYYIYKMNKLDDRPLLILGRRKVDRGLGFHYAPRLSSHPITSIDGVDGLLQTDGKDGLIWTDMIMGNRIQHLPTAIQKAGRGAGIIRQCPQYPMAFHYWIDRESADRIDHHYKTVDQANKLKGTNSILQAMTHARAIVPMTRRNHDVDPDSYRVIRGTNATHTLLLVSKIITEIFHQRYKTPYLDEQPDINSEIGRVYHPSMYKTSLNGPSRVVTLIDAIKHIPGAYGGTSNHQRAPRRFFPCYSILYDDTTLHCVIPLIDPSYTVEMKTKLDTDYNQWIIQVPQVGNLPGQEA
jgi:hypothetical protein